MKTPGAAANKHVMFMAQPPLPAELNSSEEEVSECMRWLVVCHHKLLMVRLILPSAQVTEKVKLRVLEADLVTGWWLEVNDLGDHALFVGNGCSKAILGDDQRILNSVISNNWQARVRSACSTWRRAF